MLDIYSFLYVCDGFRWCDNVHLILILCDYKRNLPHTVATCHHRFHAQRNGPRNILLPGLFCLTFVPIVSGRCLLIVLSAWLSKTWQTPEKSLHCVSVSLTPLSQSFSSPWLGGRRFPNKLAETCCLWVRLSSPPAGQQSCHPQCKQVALASRGEWAEHVGVTQTTPIQNSQLTSKNRGYGCARQASAD